MGYIYLKPGREKSLKNKHPWVYSGAIAEVKGDPGVGDTVEIRDSKGAFLAYGAFSPVSQIRTRVWTWNRDEVIDPGFFHSRLLGAVQYRELLLTTSQIPGMMESSLTSKTQHQGDALRLINGESDGIPGLIVDRYGDTLVMQILSAGPELWRKEISGLLLDVTGAENLYERSDASVRTLEGLEKRTGSIFGNPPRNLIITENGVYFKVSLESGHKTGFYLDQRENRRQIRVFAKDRDILDCFTYTGGFTLNSLVGGAKSISAIDSSAEALELARDNIQLNGLPGERVTWLLADVFQELRKFRDKGQQFDMVILDPPKFAPTASHVNKAARGYKDINLLAFKLLRPGGILVTFSCSAGISPALFQKVVADAALDAMVHGRIITRLKQSPDHPIALNHPEGDYLKGLIIQVS